MPLGAFLGTQVAQRGRTNNLPFRGQAAEVELTRGDLWSLGFWDTNRGISLGDSSCFKL